MYYYGVGDKSAAAQTGPAGETVPPVLTQRPSHVANVTINRGPVAAAAVKQTAVQHAKHAAGPAFTGLAWKSSIKAKIVANAALLENISLICLFKMI